MGGLMMKPKTVDVIVVFSSEAIEIVQACLEAVVRETCPPFRLIIVNNGSDIATTSYFIRFIGLHGGRIVRNAIMRGYPPAANQGLRASTADYSLLLNGDTIVTPGWLGNMIECAESSPDIGIVGPFSNAASWQSVPKWTGPDGYWATNPLPHPLTPAIVARMVEEVSQKEFPRIPFINGFCFLIKREVINTIGYFDDITFAEGYGEEDEYCLRAADAGFVMAVADHAYVYHVKTQTYGGEQRRRLCKQAAANIAAKYGKYRVKDNIALIKTHQGLARCRKRVADVFPQKEG
jgi:GT2 family glycosyltransferase